VLAAYDPGLCTGNALNQTTEWMLYQAWHEGSTAAPDKIHAYLWVYFDQAPKDGARDDKPALSASVHFSFTNGGLSHIELKFHIPPMKGSFSDVTWEMSGCFHIAADVATDQDGNSRSLERSRRNPGC
jgi:hypothetical protein